MHELSSYYMAFISNKYFPDTKRMSGISNKGHGFISILNRLYGLSCGS